MSKRCSVDVMQAQCDYVEHMINPQGLVDFIHEDGFDEDWESFGLSLDSDLWAFEMALTAIPELGDVIPASGGLRKARWNLPGKGKRGGVRVIYMWIPEIFMIYQFMVYAKTVQDDIRPSVLKELRREAGEIKERLLLAYGYKD